MAETTSLLYAEEYFDYLHKRTFLQRVARKAYLRDIKSYCTGATIDFGCGVGELLKILPKGSIGFEINRVAVNYCLTQGLNVMLYEPETDDYKLTPVQVNTFQSFTMNHVLEHTENTKHVIEKIFESCARLGIHRIVFTVPGIKGYKSDKTHRTFIDPSFLKKNDLLNNVYYTLKKYKYFPFNSPIVSRYFTHNELRLIFDKKNA